MRTQNQIRTETILSIMMIGFTVSIIFKYILSQYLNMDFPHDTFLFPPDDRFRDFFTNFSQTHSLDTYLNKPNLVIANYFPFIYLIIYPLTFFDAYTATYIYSFIFYMSAIFVSVYFVNRLDYEMTVSYKVFTTFILTFMNYGMLFCFDRGNAEVSLYIFLALSFIYYSKNNKKLFIFFLVLTTLIKPYAGLYSLVLLNINKIRESIISYLYFLLSLVVFFIAMMLLFSGNVFENISNLFKNSSVVDVIYDIKTMYYYSASILEPLKFFLIKFNSPYSVEIVAKTITFITLLVSFFIIAINNRFLWKKVTLITCMLVCLTPISFDYKLILFTLPIFLFITSQELESDFKSYIYAFLLGLIVIPKDYYYFSELNDAVSNYHTSVAVLINPILIYLLIIILFFDMFKSRGK